MTEHTATFSNNQTVSTKRRLAYTHAWYASGRRKSGTPWKMFGFSTLSEAGAWKSLRSDTKHLTDAGAIIDFKEVVAVTRVDERVPA
jgi:hypothetical protein